MKAETACLSTGPMTLRKERQLQRGCTAVVLSTDLRTPAYLAAWGRSRSTDWAGAHHLRLMLVCQWLCQLASHIAWGSSPLRDAQPIEFWSG